jgi:hypothetical protein
MPRPIRLLFIMAALFLAACTSEERKAEAVVRESASGAQFRIMQIGRRYGVSSWNDYVLTCRSWATRDQRGGEDLIPRGSAFVARISYIDATSMVNDLEELQSIAQLAARMLVEGEGWVAWTHRGFRLTPDACGTWYDLDPPRHLSPRLVRNDRDTVCDTEGCARGVLHNHGVSFKEVEVEKRPKPQRDRVSLVMLSSALVSSGGVAVVSEDGGATWTATPRSAQEAGRDVVLFKPDPGRLLEERKPEAPRRTSPPSPYALTEEELAAIPAPAGSDFTRRWVSKVQRSARDGNRLGVRQAYIDGMSVIRPGGERDAYRQAVLAAMLAKGPPEPAVARPVAEKEAAPPPPPALPASSYALDDAELDAIRAPNPTTPATAAFVEKVRAAAKAGQRLEARLASVEGLAVKSGDPHDLYRRAVYDAMVAKAAKAGVTQEAGWKAR